MEYKYIRDTYACPSDESKMYDEFLMPVSSKGMWVWFDEQDEPYLDLVLNYSSVNFGHCYNCQYSQGSNRKGRSNSFISYKRQT
jgi:4-aminobutyrate aminotransferase/(S)-3-amino-2-methylpropionate transaminase